MNTVTDHLTNPDWWFATTNLAVAVPIWVLAVTAVAWLRYEATVFEAATKVTQRKLTLRGFVDQALDCDRCSTYWFTVPVLVWFGPVTWLAVNGLYLVLSEHLPTLTAPEPADGLNGHPVASPIVQGGDQ